MSLLHPTTRTAPRTRRERSRSTALVERSASFLARSSTRRGFLARVAVLGSALSVAPGKFLLEPGTAYAAVCGSGSACSTGWTAFCCTTNGVNACPTGSLVGGWWKADNNGFCGGGARYYIDCQASCSRCSSGCADHFCDSGCLNCSAHCATGSCDNRRVCWNNFRYGQCHQEVACTGPVQCRVVSCTPPWQVDPSCTSASATDNRTGDHSAPCLTSQYWSPIDQKWQDVGGAGSYLGNPVEAEAVNPDHAGRRRAFAGGSIYWTSSTRAHVVKGAIRDAWKGLGWEAGPLGYPITDELPTPGGGGRYNHFRKGWLEHSIYWTSALGAHDVRGAIRAKWRTLGWEAGVLGYPATGELGTPDGRGRYNHFSKNGRTVDASIYFTPELGAWSIHGAIRVAWAASGYERGPLGYPVTDELVCPDKIGHFNHFSTDFSKQTGSVYWTPTTGAHYVRGPIRDAWKATGWEGGRLGYPISDEKATPTGAISRFQGGTITYTSATNSTTVVYA
jgi:hypothetical protein